MLSISIGNSTDSVSKLIIEGLPPLQLEVGRDGYLDGYIIHAPSLRKMFVAQNFDDTIRTIKIKKMIPLTGYKSGSLAIVRLINSRWGRVQILKRLNASKIRVYFVDTGVEQAVSIKNLYQMPEELKKKPPFAIPISTVDDGGEEVDAAELVNLKGAKVALQLGGVENSAFLIKEFTVFDLDSNSNEFLQNALKNPNFHLTKSFKSLPITTTLTPMLITTTVEPKEEKGNVAVVVISLLCVFIFVSVIGVAVACCIRKFRQKRRIQKETTEKPSASLDYSSNRNEAMLSTPESKQQTTLVIPADDLAVITAAIALANHEKDKEREKMGECAPMTEEHPMPAGLPGKTICIPARSVAAGNISHLSTIYPDDTPFPRCSTPALFTSLRTQPLRSSRISSKDDWKDDEIEDEDFSNYSDILDLRQYINKTNSLNRVVSLLLAFLQSSRSARRMRRLL